VQPSSSVQPATGLSPSQGPAVPSSSSTESRLEALSAQLHEMREMVMLSLLQNPSASERMRAVSYTSGARNVNPNIATALLMTLNNDPNVNVRLTTLEALTHFAKDPVVREGLVQSILHQESPLVQAALADVMLKLQEKRAVRPFKKLLQQKDLNEMVRDKIEQTISRLT
jgi:HEAT repeat protein